MKYSILYILILVSMTVHGQASVPSEPESAPRSTWWDSKKVKPRLGVGLQKAFFTEVGVAKNWSGGDIVRPLSSTIYSSLEWTPSSQRNVYGLKVGAETISGMGITGLEVKYQ